MQRGDQTSLMPMELQKKYWSGVGKLLHMMRWSRPDILNPTQELSRFMSRATYAHMKAMYRVMKYCVKTPKRGLYLRPNRQWDRSNKHKFNIIGRSDSNYAKEPEKRRSVSGYSVFLEGAPVVMVSQMQGHVTLLVTKSKLGAAVNCAQDMMFVKRLLESMDLKVKLPMVLEVDNKGAMDLCNNWSTGGRTRHVDV